MLTIEKLREFLGDAQADMPHKLSAELTFSDDELMEALELGARAYNSIPPFNSGRVTPNCMPDDSLLFFNACGSQALRRRVLLLSQQASTESAGGITADVDATARREMLARADAMHAEFRQEAVSRKGQRNMASFYGAV